MTKLEERDSVRLESLLNLLERLGETPIGDLLNAAIPIFEELEDPVAVHVAEEAMRGFRSAAISVQPNSQLFSTPPRLSSEINDIEFIQLNRVGMSLHELCYCYEMVQDASNKTSGGSTPTRFYLNGVYNYISSLFLIDRSKPSHKNLPMGGRVILVLHPLDLTELLDPIKNLLDVPFGDTTLGQAILNNRHIDLVHGDFSPKQVEYLINQTRMRDPRQQELFAQLIWRLFHRLIVLYLKVMSLCSSSGKDMGVVMLRYMKTKKIPIRS